MAMIGTERACCRYVGDSQLERAVLFCLCSSACPFRFFREWMPIPCSHTHSVNVVQVLMLQSKRVTVPAASTACREASTTTAVVSWALCK